MEETSYLDASRLLSVDYEVFGLVQGVYFRKYALQAANKLGVTGCVKNTRTGSIKGVIQGNKANVKLMQDWLYKEGSPECVIQGCQFQNEREIITLEFNQFKVEPSGW
ncbi:acylphosphatase-1-like [Mercenaria mercenaria]|uniref:acylphosphatase-1-like n=1 Tax=Mercenaria mercenaria TaxID=6596 RepID=UPI001E1DEE37|nr:acylphosphatase-1-like [Mercenaria mercenaria]XP_045160043.1 acylphosphatase-1-like [Mercenaria mercenaria]